MKKKKITIVGSINMDLVTSAKRVPNMGETILGEAFQTNPGGKGANQAVAAARLGADTTLIGCVGNDFFGLDLLKHLKDQGVETGFVDVAATGTPTGIASITIAHHDNQIIVVPGANSKVTPDFVASQEEVIASSDILLLQLEIPLESVEKAMKIARKHEVTVILNPAPIQLLSKELLQMADYLTPNEHESQLLFGAFDGTEEERDALLSKCVITKGSKGIVFYHEQKVEVPSFHVDVVDTTGAGDTFNGALAYSLSEGANLEAACTFANAAAALSVTKLGAQAGMPTLEEVRVFLEKQNRK